MENAVFPMRPEFYLKKTKSENNIRIIDKEISLTANPLHIIDKKRINHEKGATKSIITLYSIFEYIIILLKANKKDAR